MCRNVNWPDEIDVAKSKLNTRTNTRLCYKNSRKYTIYGIDTERNVSF